MSAEKNSLFHSPLPLLPLRNGVIFPGTATAVPVGRPRSLALVRALVPGSILGLGAQRDRMVDDPVLSDLLPIGTYARVQSIATAGPNQYRLVLEGLGRWHLRRLVSTEPYWQAEGEPVAEPRENDLEARALAQVLVDRVQRQASMLNEGLKEALTSASILENPGLLADVIAASLALPAEKEAEVLMALDVGQRLRIVHHLLDEAEALSELRSRIDREVSRGLNRSQRETLLRQHLRAIQKELGEEDEAADELAELRRRLENASLPDEPHKVALRELKRLEAMGAAQPEYHVTRKYLEFIADLPWNKRSAVNEDLDRVQQKLDADHYGLEDVKKHIIEHLAVRKMTGNYRGAILCLVGPPGVGKTSLGKSVAEATGRPFVRVSLGGIRDEAEIRGHRRTYVGALPGRILTALRKAGAKNPVLLIDEVDKLTQGWMGSPEAALLEVLDPEQNNTFTDSYLELPFDLSEVFFICTANTLETLSPPLRDRLEIIELQGYTPEEKRHIAEQHLIPARLAEHGLRPGAVTFSGEALGTIIADYTREAGVRQLTRELVRICRGVTLELARNPEGEHGPVHIGRTELPRYLGRPRFFNDMAERTAQPGVVTGLAWTPVGGEILFVETSRMPGRGQLEITGMLGEVMKESAQAALSYVRSHAELLGVDPGFLEKQDIHIHVPAGAIPKDGPSAGVTIFTALASLLTGRLARPGTAMTGEVTLRGRVLPVGGIKAKVLAAHRTGIRRVILPEKNRRDLEEVPEEVVSDLEFVFADDMSQVLEAALEPALPEMAGLPPENIDEGQQPPAQDVAA